MSGIWQERVLKKPEDFHAALWAGSCGITEDFALGYATALYDTEAVDMAGLTAYVTASASGAFSHNLDFKANEDRLAEEVDMAAFGMAAEDADLSNMLSALSRALKKGALDGFKSEWLSTDKIGGDEG